MRDTIDAPRGGSAPADFTDLLVCPLCRSALRWEGAEASCANDDCSGRFRMVGGIPVLVDEPASPQAFGPDGVHHNKSKAKSLALKYLPALDLNVVPDAVKTRLVAEILALSERPRVLNVGGKHPTSLTKEICGHKDVEALECDLAYRPRTRILADPAHIPLADESVHAVLLDGLLEHVAEPQAVVDEAWRVLKPGGVVYADTPFMLPVHGGPFDYVRFSHQAHRWLFRRFSKIESGVSSGPGVALSYAIQYFLLSFARGDRTRYAVKVFCRLAFFWIKYFDLVLAKRPAALDAAHGTYFLGRKSDHTLTENDLLDQYQGKIAPLYPPATRR